ncbi:MAG: glutathione S-transferase [Cellvibrionaceae bacterium]|jgi:glutathione S-transferase
MKLYTSPKSGNGYKVELFLNLLELDFERIYVDMANGAHKSADYLALNPRGQVPVLTDNDHNYWESQSILVYIAKKYAPESWLPQEPTALAKTIRWLSFSAAEVDGLTVARRIRLFGWDHDLTPHQQKGISGLIIMDAHLATNDFLAGDRPTVADIACYPYVAMAGEGEVDLAPYANVNKWFERIQKLPGYINLP